MPKSKTRKVHKQKLKSRNLKKLHDKKHIEKQRQRILEQLIAQEQEAGKFDENVNIDIGPEI
jgi:hypothetical protein|tara:strand:- start:461 stop:646 length:186 start_codon:yes stop_codon:yes gene_type:complete